MKTTTLPQPLRGVRVHVENSHSICVCLEVCVWNSTSVAVRRAYVHGKRLSTYTERGECAAQSSASRAERGGVHIESMTRAAGQ